MRRVISVRLLPAVRHSYVRASATDATLARSGLGASSALAPQWGRCVRSTSGRLGDGTLCSSRIRSAVRKPGRHEAPASAEACLDEENRRQPLPSRANKPTRRPTCFTAAAALHRPTPRIIPVRRGNKQSRGRRQIKSVRHQHHQSANGPGCRRGLIAGKLTRRRSVGHLLYGYAVDGPAPCHGRRLPPLPIAAVSCVFSHDQPIRA